MTDEPKVPSEADKEAMDQAAKRPEVKKIHDEIEDETRAGEAAGDAIWKQTEKDS